MIALGKIEQARYLGMKILQCSSLASLVRPDEPRRSCIRAFKPCGGLKAALCKPEVGDPAERPGQSQARIDAVTFEQGGSPMQIYVQVMTWDELLPT